MPVTGHGKQDEVSHIGQLGDVAKSSSPFQYLFVRTLAPSQSGPVRIEFPMSRENVSISVSLCIHGGASELYCFQIYGGKVEIEVFHAELIL